MVLLEYVLREELIFLFPSISSLVYEAITKESDLTDLESKHLAKRAKHNHTDTR